MPDALLHRFESTDEGTFGEFLFGGLRLFSGELPDRGNQPSISCIPPWEGRCDYTYSPRFMRSLYLLSNTDPRIGIREHPANLMGDRLLGYRSQLNGCIALGEKLGWMEGQKCLLFSAPAIRMMEEYFGGRPFTLRIENGYTIRDSN